MSKRYDYIVNIISGAVDIYDYNTSHKYIDHDSRLCVFHSLNEAWFSLSTKQKQEWKSKYALNKFLKENK